MSLFDPKVTVTLALRCGSPQEVDPLDSKYRYEANKVADQVVATTVTRSTYQQVMASIWSKTQPELLRLCYNSVYTLSGGGCDYFDHQPNRWHVPMRLVAHDRRGQLLLTMERPDPNASEIARVSEAITQLSATHPDLARNPQAQLERRLWNLRRQMLTEAFDAEQARLATSLAPYSDALAEPELTANETATQA